MSTPTSDHLTRLRIEKRDKSPRVHHYDRSLIVSRGINGAFCILRVRVDKDDERDVGAGLDLQPAELAQAVEWMTERLWAARLAYLAHLCPEAMEGEYATRHTGTTREAAEDLAWTEFEQPGRLLPTDVGFSWEAVDVACTGEDGRLIEPVREALAG